MKITYTHLVGMESDEHSAVIKFRPQGSDSGDQPIEVRISPHGTYIHLTLSNIKDKGITNIEHGANIANIHYGEPERHGIKYGGFD